MEVVREAQEARRAVIAARRGGRSLGLVPTMGYLHAGHAALIAQAARECDEVVVSIFVNPTQFGPNEDFARYPRDMARDLRVCADAGASWVFAPEPTALYPDGPTAPGTMVHPPEPLTRGLCGAFRPGHFVGVATVVAKLLALWQPDKAYFGLKDFQQTAVLRALARDLLFPVEVVLAPTVREPDGLAMSSRNVYLSTEERRRALVISRALRKVEASAAAGERRISALRTTLEAVLAEEPEVRRQYAVVVDANTLAECETLNRPCVALVAAHVGSTRLIDNVVLNGECGMGIGE